MTRPCPPPPPSPLASPAERVKYNRLRIKNMAIWEIHKRSGNIFSAIWWNWIPGEIITVKWPTGMIDEYCEPFNGRQIFSADPNDFYRSELEKLCGRQGRNWDWRHVNDDNLLHIKFRSKFAKYAAYFAIKWNS